MRRSHILFPLCLCLPAAGCVDDAVAEGSSAAVAPTEKLPGYCTSITFERDDEGVETERHRVTQTWELATPRAQSRLTETLAEEAPYDDEPDWGDTRTRYTVQRPIEVPEGGLGPIGADVRIERSEMDSMLDGRTDVAESKTFVDGRLTRQESWIYEPGLPGAPLQVVSNNVYIPGYDAEGRMITEEFETDGSKSGIHRSTFEGGLLRRKEIDHDMDGVADVVRTYDYRDGRLVRETEEHPAGAWENTVTTYTFDADGRPLDDVEATPDGSQIVSATRRTYTTEPGGVRVVERSESHPLQDPNDPDTITVSATNPYRDELRDAHGNILEERRGWDDDSISEVTRYGFDCFVPAAAAE